MPIDKKKEWSITLGSQNGWGGLCPSWFDNTYPFYGNKNQASIAENVNLIDPNVLTQGPGISDLDDGSEAGALTTKYPITSILKNITSSNVSFAIGGKLLHKLTATAVINTGAFPRSITGTGAVVGSDVCHYKAALFYSYEDADLGGAGTKHGNIGRYNLDATFDDDYWTAAVSGDNLENAPHYMIVGGDDVMYITNGEYVAKLDGTTATADAIDFHADSITVSLVWNSNKVKIAVNRPNVTGSNFDSSAIYNWDGYSPSWEGDPIEVKGEIGALYVKNGVEFVWWKDSTSTGGYNFGYISGLRVKIIKRYSGSLPNHVQVGEYDGHIAWLSNDDLILWGAKDEDVEVKMFKYMTSKYTTTIGAFSTPFGTPLISSTKSDTCTAAVDNIVTSTLDAHGLVDDDTIVFGTSHTLPAGLSVDTLYYIINATTGTFKVSTSEGGSEVDITDTGTGIQSWYRHSIGRAWQYSVSTSYKTVAFPVSGIDFKSQIDLIMVEFETLVSGAKCDFTLTYDKAASTQSLTQIAYSATDASTRRKILDRSVSVEDFRLDISHANGSAINSFNIRSIFIKGHYTKFN